MSLTVIRHADMLVPSPSLPRRRYGLIAPTITGRSHAAHREPLDRTDLSLWKAASRVFGAGLCTCAVARAYRLERVAQ